MNNTSGVLNVIFGGLLLVLVFITVNQFNSLNDTQDELDAALVSGTQSAEQASDSLNSANANATQAIGDAIATLEQANADATAAIGEANNVVEQANTYATQAASDASAAQDSLMAEATEELAAAQATADALIADLELSLADSAALVTDLSAQVSENEELLSIINAEATTSADNIALTATQQANEIADAQATIASLESSVSDAQATVSALDAARAADVTATPFPTMTPFPGQTATATANAEENQAPSDGDRDAPEGFILFEGVDFEMLIPDDFIAFDLRTDQQAAIETFGDLGLEYIGMQSIARAGDGLIIFTAAADEPNRNGTVDIILMLRQPLAQSMSMQQFLDQEIDILVAGANVLDQDIIQINGEDVGTVLFEMSGNGLTVRQLGYVYNVDDVIYLILFAALDNLFDNREDAYEFSGESFRPR